MTLRSRGPGRIFSTIDCVILACTMTCPDIGFRGKYTVLGTHWGLKWVAIGEYMGVPGRVRYRLNMLLFMQLLYSALIQLGNRNTRDIFRDVGVAGSNPVTPTKINNLGR